MKKLFVTLLLLAPGAAFAQGLNNFNLNALNNISTYSTRNIYATIASLVNWILGFLGTIALLLFLYGGFKWLTSQGSSDKIDEAKKLMGAAVVGIAIIFASYAVSTFIIGSLYNQVAA